MKKVIIFVMLIGMILPGCSVMRMFDKEEPFHMEYSFYDPEEPTLRLFFPYKTYYIGKKETEKGQVSCKTYTVRTKRPGEFHVEINKCTVEPPYDWVSRHIARLQSKPILINEKNKSLGISGYSVKDGFGLKGEIVYFVDTQTIIEIVITRNFYNMDATIIDQADWFKKNPQSVDVFKSFVQHVFREMVVDGPQ